MASAPPPQTRGFLFADLRGYSAFTERHGDQAARELLSRYRALVRDVIATFNGAEIRTEGDSFYVVFESVSHAVRAGLAILEAVAEPDVDAAGRPIAVGIGVHAGETEDSVEGIVSGAVNVAARICGQAKAGELLVSDTVRALTRTYLDVVFVPRGRRRLKGIAEPVGLYSVKSQSATQAPARNRPRAGVVALAVGGSLALLLVALLAWSPISEWIAGRDLAASTSRPGPSTSTAGTSTEAATASAATDGATPFPNEAEASLLARLNVDADGCVRADDDEIPRLPNFYDPGVHAMSVAAGLRCPGGASADEPDDVLFFLPTAEQRTEEGIGGGDPVSGGAPDVASALRSVIGRLSLPPGGCTEGAEGYVDWELGPSSGLVVCYHASNGDATIAWSLESDPVPVLGRAIGRDDDLATLFRWWRDVGRLSVDP